MNHEAKELEAIEKLLDDLGIPRKTKANADFTVFGRVYVLGEKYTEMLKKSFSKESQHNEH